jgi:hypothetical protein
MYGIAVDSGSRPNPNPKRAQRGRQANQAACDRVSCQQQMIASPPSCWVPIAMLPSIFNGKTFPDFIDPLVQRVKSCVKTSVVKVKYISGCQKSENPVVSFHVDQYLLNRVTDKNNNVPQDVHRIRSLEN